MISHIEDTKTASGVYCIIHRESLMCYVGSSTDVWKRRSSHRSETRRGSRSCFHRALREFGEGAFDFEIVERCPQDKLKEREDFWIVFLNAASVNGFNTRKSSNGSKPTEVSQATRDRISYANKGRKRSPEYCLAASLLRKGKKSTWCPTDEQCRRISERQKGRKLLEHTKKLIGDATRGIKRSPETIEKIRKNSTGRKHSEETKRRISEIRKLFWINKKATPLCPQV